MTSNSPSTKIKKSQCSSYSIFDYNCLISNINEAHEYTQKNILKIAITGITLLAPILIITYEVNQFRKMNYSIKTLTDQARIQKNYIASTEKALQIARSKLAEETSKSLGLFKIIEDLQFKLEIDASVAEHEILLREEELPANEVPTLITDAETSTDDFLEYLSKI